MGRRVLLLVALALVACAGAMALHRAAAPGHRAAPETSLTLLDVLGAHGDDARFERALAPRAFAFPQDHGPHPRFRTEWWYWTGNVVTGDGRRFGYQLTMFRSALGPLEAPRASAWATNQAYMAHFAMTDIDGGHFHAFERLSRGAVGLAGAMGEPFAVWVLDWSATAAAPEGGPPRVRLRATEGDVAIDLEVAEGRAPVPQGRAGLSQKGSQPGNASYYYSLTRMPTRGTITAAGRSFSVEGSSWMDREWSTSALEEGQIGWDWFALQLDDGTDIMFFRLRRADGSADVHSHGSIVSASGEVTELASSDVRLEVLATWRSPRSGTIYPSRFRFAVARGGLSLDLTVTPAREDQELDLRFRYWEGAVEVRGRPGSPPAFGRGYVELTGYDRGLQNRP